MCDLKKVFVSHTTCSNAAHQLVDRLFLLCKIETAGICKLVGTVAAKTAIEGTNLDLLSDIPSILFSLKFLPLIGNKYLAFTIDYILSWKVLK